VARSQFAPYEPRAANAAIGDPVTPLPTEHYFTDEAVCEWTRIADRHHLRDEQFLRVLSRWFQPGPILEIGAATGQLSAILHRRGYDVLASDYSPVLVSAIRARGVPAAVVDATADIRGQAGRVFANVLAQGVLPLIWRDRATVVSALAAVHGALMPRGRLICITPHPRWSKDSQSYFTPREQIEIASAMGLYRLVAAFPHQVIPTGWYRRWNASLFNLLDFHAAHLLSIRLVCVMEKIDSRAAAGQFGSVIPAKAGTQKR
jgi:SAM-dependent methyltransferase